MNKTDCRLCGCKEDCFEIGESWGHLGGTMCEYLGEKHVGSTVYSWCLKSDAPIIPYFHITEYKTLIGEQIMEKDNAIKKIDEIIEKLDHLQRIEYAFKSTKAIIEDCYKNHCNDFSKNVDIYSALSFVEKYLREPKIVHRSSAFLCLARSMDPEKYELSDNLINKIAKRVSDSKLVDNKYVHAKSAVVFTVKTVAYEEKFCNWALHAVVDHLLTHDFPNDVIWGLEDEETTQKYKEIVSKRLEVLISRGEEILNSKNLDKLKIVWAMQITEDVFSEDHPNKKHLSGLVYSPVLKRVAVAEDIFAGVGVIGDWIVKDEEKFSFVPDEIFQTTYKNVLGTSDDVLKEFHNRGNL